MGAYENPVTVIDDSWKSWAAAITNLGNTAAKQAEERKKLQRENNKLLASKIDKINENNTDQFRLYKQAAIDADVLNHEEIDTLWDIMQQKNQLEISELTASGKEKNILRTKINDLDTDLMSYVPFVKLTKDSDNFFMTDSIGGDPNNIGDQGYASMALDNDYIIAKMINSKYLKGGRKLVKDDVQGWGWEYTTSGEERKEGGVDRIEGDDKTFTIWGNADANFRATEVPTINETFADILSRLNIVNKAGGLNPQFLSKNAEDFTVELNPDGTGKVAVMKGDAPLILATINDSLDNAFNNYTDREKISIWKDIFLQKDDIDLKTGSQDLKDLKQMFKKHVSQFIPNINMSEDSEEMNELQVTHPELWGKVNTAMVTKNIGDPLEVKDHDAAALEIYNEIWTNPAAAFTEYSALTGEVATEVEQGVIEIPRFDESIEKGVPVKTPLAPTRINLNTEKGRRQFFRIVLEDSKILNDYSKEDRKILLKKLRAMGSEKTEEHLKKYEQSKIGNSQNDFSDLKE